MDGLIKMYLRAHGCKLQLDWLVYNHEEVTPVPLSHDVKAKVKT